MKCNGCNAHSLYMYIDCQNIQQTRKGALKCTKNKQYKLLLRKLAQQSKYIQRSQSSRNMRTRNKHSLSITNTSRHSHDIQPHKHVPTLSLAFTSNPQDLTRYSTMDNWPSWAAQCNAVALLSSQSKRWPSILGARYSATVRWPPSAHK